MRPAYQTRCYMCGCRITVPDVMQYEKRVLPDGKIYECRWFDPDVWIQLNHIRKAHKGH